MIQAIDERAWRAEPLGKGRDIASIAAHMHNVRVMWLKAALSKGREVPNQLDRFTAKQKQVCDSFESSPAALRESIAESLLGEGRIKSFRLDVASFIGYIIAQDAHHRGQTAMHARQLEFAVSQKVMFGMWEWNRFAST